MISFLSFPNEVYNAIFALWYSLDYSSLSVNIDNEQCFSILERMGNNDPIFEDVNELIAANISLITGILIFNVVKLIFSKYEIWRKRSRILRYPTKSDSLFK